MAFKIIMLFNGNTVRANPIPSIGLAGKSHAFGFTENFYMAQSVFGSLTENYVRTIAQKRSLLLPATTDIVGIRVYDLDTGGLVRNIPVQYGNGGYLTDEPQVSVLLRTQIAGVKTQRSWWLHNTPDFMVSGGEFVPTAPYQTAIQAYFQALAAACWRRELFMNYSAIIGVDVTGRVTLQAANPFNVGDYVTITRTTALNGRRHGARLPVGTVGPGPNQFTVTGWPYGTSSGGHVYVSQKTLEGFATGGVFPICVRAGKRNIGRPLELYRGRRTAQRA